jgi:ParB family transcriptional regulator, chromosome partitioning protein
MLERFVKSIVEKEGKKSVVEIPIDTISVNPYQPRRNFDQKKLDELAKSIKEQGVIQPIIVRRFGGGYELVAGERRLRASKLIGLKTIPAIVRQLDDQDMIEIAFIENLQREQLDEVETADAYSRLMTERGDSAESVADRIGKDVDAIKARLWMLQLPQVVKKAVVSKLISLEHARLIANLASEKKQIEMLELIYREKLTVDQTKERISLVPEYLKVRPKESEKHGAAATKRFRYLPENLGQAEACVDLLRGLVQSLRSAGVRVSVSELITGSAVNVKLSFPLHREECPAEPQPEQKDI